MVAQPQPQGTEATPATAQNTSDVSISTLYWYPRLMRMGIDNRMVIVMIAASLCSSIDLSTSKSGL